MIEGTHAAALETMDIGVIVNGVTLVVLALGVLAWRSFTSGAEQAAKEIPGDHRFAVLQQVSSAPDGLGQRR